MREILFRGKAMDGEWYEGGLCKETHEKPSKTTVTYKIQELNYGYASEYDFDHTYMSGFDVAVIPETVGQYTGLTDKNGKGIFEGDIVKTETDLYSGETKKERVTRIGVVVYDKMFCQFGLDIRGFSRCFTLKRWSGDFNEVVGNIHDNPELLKGE